MRTHHVVVNGKPQRQDQVGRPVTQIDEAVKLDLPSALRWLADFLEPHCFGGVGTFDPKALTRREFQILQTALFSDHRLRNDLQKAVEVEAQRRGLHMTVVT